MTNARSLAAALIIGWLAAGPARGGDADKYAGIEIGGKGVKAIVVEVRADDGGFSLPDRPRELKPEKPKGGVTANTTLAQLDGQGNFYPEAINETAYVVGMLYKRILADYKVPGDHVFVVGSSSVQHMARNRGQLVAQVQKKIGRVEVAFLDVADEMALEILGVVRDNEELESSVMWDIGSGNTKGGYYEQLAADLVQFWVIPGSGSMVEIPGSVAFARLIRKAPAAGPEAIVDLRRRIIEEPMRKEIGRKARFESAERFYLTGGAVWAMTTLMYPEQIRSRYVRIQVDDIEEFRRLLGGFRVSDEAKDFPPPRLGRLPAGDPGLRKEVQAEERRVRGAFTVNNLIAGVEILRGIAATCNLTGKTAGAPEEILFPRESRFAWLMSYIRMRSKTGPLGVAERPTTP